MSQANANLFGGDFFPTPRQVARKMLASNSVMSSKIWRRGRNPARDRRHRAADLREVYDQVDEHAACGEVSAYRSMRTDPPLSRAADIDMALFGLSEIVWPF